MISASYGLQKWGIRASCNRLLASSVFAFWIVFAWRFRAWRQGILIVKYTTYEAEVEAEVADVSGNWTDRNEKISLPPDDTLKILPSIVKAYTAVEVCAIP